MKAHPERGSADTLVPVPLRVLIVEDSEEDTLLLLRELRRGGYETAHERVDTPEAMQEALAERGPWDLVICDWLMPRFSATGALEMLRAAGSEAPFIIASGIVGEETALEAMRAGAHDYVMKDNLTRLCATVERGLKEAKAHKERERAQRSLKESEERFRSLVMNSSDMITLFTPDGTRLYASPSIERVLGYKPEEIIGGNAFDLVHPDDAPGLREEFAERARTPGTGKPFEFRSRHADGTWRTFESIATNLLDDPSVDGIVFNARDITDRKRTEEERDRLFEFSLDLLCVAGLDGYFRRVNPAFEETLGYSRSELLAKPFIEFVHPEDRAATISEMESLARGVRTAYFENRYLRKDGSQVWLEWKAVPIVEEDMIYATARDVTERKKAEEALRQSEQLYRTVIEQATEYISLVDVESKRIVGSNSAFREALGYTEEELKNMTLYDIVAHDRESIDTNVRQALERGRYLVGERKHRRKDGSLVDVEVSASTIVHEGREVFCVVGHDVTERVGAHRMLERRVAALAGIAASLTVDRPMESTLNALAAGIVESTAAVACSVVLIDPQTSMIRLAGSHGLPEGYTGAMQASWRAGIHGRMVRVFRSQRPSLVHDARRVLLENPLYAPIHPLVREVRWDVVYIVPLVVRGEALGAINLYYLPGQEPGVDEKVFLGAVADQAAVAVENARLFAAAQGKAALEERQRLARELHDSVSQALYGIGLGVRTARTLLDRESPPDRVAEWLEYVLTLTDSGLTEMRALIFELRPESLEAEGLIAALEKQAAALQARHEIPVHAALGEEPDLPPEAKEALYRIAQEALHNTVKHARASRVDLKLECDAQGISLEVCDDGAGFDPEGSFSGHLGLKSMRERAARLDATLRIESAPGEGTQIRLQIPAESG